MNLVPAYLVQIYKGGQEWCTPGEIHQDLRLLGEDYPGLSHVSAGLIKKAVTTLYSELSL